MINLEKGIWNTFFFREIILYLNKTTQVDVKITSGVLRF